jgi:galactose-1-phosphate uridylyltransferase
MTFLKKILDNYFNSFLEENTINVMCWDSATDGEIHFYLELHSYPPIGSLINMEKYPKMFKIESLEIQSSRGAFCIAYGVFLA